MRTYLANLIKVSLFLLLIPITFANTVVTCDLANCPLIEKTLPSAETLDNQIIVFQSTVNKHLMVRSEMGFSEKSNGGWQHILVDEFVYQTGDPFIGFGGAFTDSAAILYQNLPESLKADFIDAYFSHQGIGYTLGRVPIASSDFSCRDENNEPALKNCSHITSPYFYLQPITQAFNLQKEDLLYKIPMVKDAMRKTESGGDAMKLFASPWSAPAYMKTTGHVIHGSLLPQFYQDWTQYLLNFLKAYDNEGIHFWGMTVQNEPVEDAWSGQYQFQQWQTMYFSKELEAHFVKKYLGPALAAYREETKRHINLIIHDDQLKTIDARMSMLEDETLAKYVNGAGLHWYMNADGSLSKLDKAYTWLNPHDRPFDRFIIATEACNGYLPYDKGPRLGNWSRAEYYAHDIINDLNHYVSGWTDWNLALDMQGGPNWAKNYVDAPILIDVLNKRFYKQPMYYYLGHFSRFIRPGSYLLASQSLGLFPLEEVTFKVPSYDNLPSTIVIVVLNRDITGRKYYIHDQSRPANQQYINMEIPAHSIQTIIFKAAEKDE